MWTSFVVPAVHSSSLIPFIHLEWDPSPRSNVTFIKALLIPVINFEAIIFEPEIRVETNPFEPLVPSLALLGCLSPSTQAPQTFLFDRIMLGILAFLPECHPVL